MENRKLTQEELQQIARLDSPRLNMLAAWANKQLTCSHCKRCATRCEVLKEANLDVGLVEEAYERVMAHASEERTQVVLQLVEERPQMYHALRQCCFCGHCTAACCHHVLAADRMRDWRILFMEAGLMPLDDSRIVMVDNEWHLFSAYRAIYGIGYPEFMYLSQAAEAGPGCVDTLFFPGCSLVSYAPELTRAVGNWLTQAGVAWALSDDCCGSPLMSAGLFDRAAALRERILDQMRAAGITRMLTVCPGCGEEFTETMGDEIDVVPLPEFMLELIDAGKVAFASNAGVEARAKASSSAQAAEEGEATFADTTALDDRVFGAAAAIDTALVDTAISAGSTSDTAVPAGSNLNAAASAGFSPLSTASVTVFDSCHDRADGRHGAAIRALLQRFLPDAVQLEMDHRKRGTLCCGAGGAVGSYDADITDRRVWRAINEARATGAQTMVTMCPTCSYTVAQACLGAPERGIESRQYLELLFGQTIDWKQVFAQLEGMWSGEYAAWLTATFYG